MYYFDHTFPRPPENLACDEALLDACEEDGALPVLRFWQPTQPFVVLGYGNKFRSEVNVEFCEQARIPILRRCTGGGTVLQLHGCLNYSLILPIDESSGLHTVSSANRIIMQRTSEALQPFHPAPIKIQGCTDLAIDGLKFSGNSQRRKKRFLLFHGSLLLSADNSLIEQALAVPARQPDYRKNRRHSDFLTNLRIPPEKVKAALRHAWDAQLPFSNIPENRITRLCAEKYDSEAWNRKF